MASPSTYIEEISVSKASSGSRRTTGYRRDIDGLRAVAVLAVIGFHCGIPWLRGGYVGVDVFFVISGYLICSIIFKDLQSGTFSIARFYERRFKRIVPALAVVLLFCLAMAALVMSPEEARKLGVSEIATAVSGSNFLFIHRAGYFAQFSGEQPLLMTWSLAVEEQFYIVFPLILIGLRGLTKRSLLVTLAALCALSLLASVVMEFRSPTWNFYLPITRAWELGAGAMLAVWRSDRTATGRTSWMADAGGAAGLLMLASAMLLYTPATRFPGYEAILPVLGSVLILASEGGRANRLLGIRPLVAVGLVSYSLYLWHWPWLSYALVMSGHPLGAPTKILLMSIAFACAIASYFWVEKPFRSMKFARPRTALAAYGVTLLLLVFAGGVFSTTDGLAFRAPNLAAIETRAGLDRDHGCLVTEFAKLSPRCTAPPFPGKPSVALLGDSHAEAISKELRASLPKDRARLVVLAHERCPPTIGTTRWISDVEQTESCRQFNQTALAYVLGRADIKTVVMIAGWGNRTYIRDGFAGNPTSQNDEQNAENLKSGIQSEIAALESHGKRVVLMDDFPELAFNPVLSVRYRELPMRRAFNRLLLSEEPEHWQESYEDTSLAETPNLKLASEKLAEIAAADAHVSLIDPKTAFCHGERCYFANESNLYYVDQDHVSDVGTRLILPFLPKLNSAEQTP